jgi:hypothetical protein
LAGEAAADEVDGLEVVSSDCADVVVASGVGKVLGKDGSAELGLFDLPAGVHADPLKPEVEAADAREEGTDTQHPPTVRCRSMSSRPLARR